METNNKQTISMDKKYKTRDGRNVHALAGDIRCPDFPVVAAIEVESEERAEFFTAKGKFFGSIIDCEADLIEVNIDCEEGDVKDGK